MAQTVLEIKAENGLKNSDNSWFQQVFPEPIELAAGSSVNLLTSFIDIGTENIADSIYIPKTFRLGINFYRYDMDIPRIPSTVGTDPMPYNKRNIYYFPSVPPDTPDVSVDFTPIDHKRDNSGTPDRRPYSQYGYKTATYGNSNLPAFLFKRTNQTTTGGPEPTRTDYFTVEEETAYIDIPPGFYSKVKFTQIVNDGFNLINGTLTDPTKSIVNVVPVAGGNPSQNTVTPVDYQSPPNNTSNLLKAYLYPYTTSSVKAKDPISLQPQNEIYINDLTWNYWFIPIYVPPEPPYILPEDEYLPYMWYNSAQSGFLAGTCKFNLNYDMDNQIFFIDYLHTPIFDTAGREVVLFSKTRQYYEDFLGDGRNKLQNDGYKANGSQGGIMISRLFSYDYDDAGNPIEINTGFWQNTLRFGFDDTYRNKINTSFVNKTWTVFNNYDGPGTPKYACSYTFDISYPNPRYLVLGTTQALVPLQFMSMTNETDPTKMQGMSIYSSDIPKQFASVGNKVIYGEQGAYAPPVPYWLLEINISHLKNDNFRDQDTYRQIMNICGKYYNSTSGYIQSYSDGSIQALNIYEPIVIDKIECRILNPDKTPAQNLGPGTSIFLTLNQPVIVQK